MQNNENNNNNNGDNNNNNEHNNNNNEDDDNILTLEELFLFLEKYVPHLVKTEKQRSQQPYFSEQGKEEYLPIYFFR